MATPDQTSDQAAAKKQEPARESAEPADAKEDKAKDSVAGSEAKDKKKEAKTEKAAPAGKSAFSAVKKVDGVTVQVSAPKGVFPEGASLSVSKVSKADQDKVEKALADVRESDVNVVSSYLFDIKVLDQNGKEVQPADQQKVQVSFTTNAVKNANLDTSVYHIDETAGIKASAVDRLEVKTKSNTATVETKSFPTTRWSSPTTIGSTCWMGTAPWP